MMTVNEFIKDMAAQGFTGEFRATSGEHTYRGSIDKNGVIKTVKVQTIAQSREKISEMFKKTDRSNYE